MGKVNPNVGIPKDPTLWFEAVCYKEGQGEDGPAECIQILANDMKGAEDLAGNCVEPGWYVGAIYKQGTKADYDLWSSADKDDDDWELDDMVERGYGLE